MDILARPISQKKKAAYLRNIFPIAVLILSGLLLRLPQLTAENIWLDEYYSLKTAQILPDLLRSNELIQRVGVVPVGYFVLLFGWIQLFGMSLFAVRFLSVVLGMGGVYAVYALGARLRNRTTGLIAAGLLNIHAGHFFHSQDARHYALFLLLTVALFLLFEHYLMTRGRGALVALVATEFLLVNTHFFGIFTVAVIHILYLFFGRQDDGKRWVRYHGLAVVGAVLILPLYSGMAIDQSRRISAMEYKSWGRELGDIAQWLAFGGDEFAERSVQIPAMSRKFAAPLMSVLMMVGCWQWAQTDRRKFLSVLLWLTVPLAALLLISRIYRPVILQRHIFNLTPAYVLFVAVAIEGFWRRRKGAGLLALCAVMATMVPALWAQNTHVKRFPMQDAAEELRRFYKKGDVILVLPWYSREHLAFFLNPAYALKRQHKLDHGRIERTPYVKKYHGTGDERFWFFLEDDLFEPFEDAATPDEDKPIYIMVHAQNMMRFFTYYPYALYPDRLIIITNRWGQTDGKTDLILWSRFIRPVYELLHENNWNDRDVCLYVVERKEIAATH